MAKKVKERKEFRDWMVICAAQGALLGLALVAGAKIGEVKIGKKLLDKDPELFATTYKTLSGK